MRRSGDDAPGETADAEAGAAGDCDFFLTHARADVGWAEWIAWQLEEHVRFDGRKAQVFLEAWDIVPGSDLVANISRMLDRSDRVVPILSPHYFADSGNQVWSAAWTGDQDRLRRIVPVRVEVCEPSGLLRTIHYIDLVGMDARAAAAALRTGMSDAIKGRAKPADAPAFPMTAAVARATEPPPSFPGGGSTPTPPREDPPRSDEGRSTPPTVAVPPPIPIPADDVDPADDPSDRPKGPRHLRAAVLRRLAAVGRPFPARSKRRRWAVAALVILVAGAVSTPFVPWPGGRSFDHCRIPTELVLSTSADTADLMRELTQNFIDADRVDGCRRENIQVVSPTAAGGTTKALADGWPADDLRNVGPYPHVWMPSSSVEVARVQQALRASGSAITLTSLPSVMSSYLVLAAPKSLVGRPGWDDPTGLSLAEVLRQAENSTLRIDREGPEASTEGLISTMALYRAAIGPLDEKTLGDGQTRAALHRLEQATITSGGIEDPGRGLGCRAATSARRDVEVAFMSEQRVFTHNVQQSPSCGVPAENLTAFYPTDGAPLLDYPFVIVGGERWGDRQREAVARRLHDFLTGEVARSRLAEFGFRPPGGAALDGSPPDSGVQDEPPHTIYQVVDPDGRSVVPDALVQTWRSVRRQARVLFAVDVSGSMDVPGTDGVTLLDSAKQAIEPALDLVSSADEIGLWEFSTALDGTRDYAEKVGLGPAGTDSGSRRDEVRRALAGLHRKNGDTGLFDTIQAGVAALRADEDTTTADALVVFTDGINDKPGGAGADGLVADLNRPGAPPVRVFLLAFGEANCARADLQTLLAGGAKCENVSSTDVSRAVERVGAGLWGVD